MEAHEGQMAPKSKSGLDFVSMGMLIIDDVHYDDGRRPLANVIGGAGTYATVGARLFCESPADPTSVGFVVHAGSDFPRQTRKEIESWESATIIIETPERYTTRGKNTYRDGLREFEFLNEKIQVIPSMLNSPMKLSKTYHLICSPNRCIELVEKIIAERQAALGEGSESDIARRRNSNPIIVWEPMEGSCRPDELPAFYKALRHVDVFSPNEIELGMLFTAAKALDESSITEMTLIECSLQLLTHGFGDIPGCVVIRMGENGCMVGSSDGFRRFPAYHPLQTNVKFESQNKVVDVTGGGNAFVGGFCKGLLATQNGDLDRHGFTRCEQAAIYGSVAASFAIEQISVPKLTHRGDGKELWNGDMVQSRLDTMRLKATAHLQPF